MISDIYCGMREFDRKKIVGFHLVNQYGHHFITHVENGLGKIEKVIADTVENAFFPHDCANCDEEEKVRCHERKNRFIMSGQVKGSL